MGVLRQRALPLCPLTTNYCYCSVPQIRYTKVRLRRLGGFGGRPHTQGLARWLSCLVATLVADSISPASAKLCPAKASRRNTLHHPSCRLSQHAPTGMKIFVCLLEFFSGLLALAQCYSVELLRVRRLTLRLRVRKASLPPSGRPPRRAPL